MKRGNLYYLYRFLRWKFGDKSPIVAGLKVTQRCNLKCSHCSWKNRIRVDLSTTRWKEVIRNVWNLGCTVVTFEGGEPTLRTDLQQLIEYSTNLGLRTIVVTNGTQDISNITPNRIWISIEGNRDINDQIRGAGTFDRALQTIKKNQKKTIMTLTTISKTNYLDIEQMCKALSNYVDGFLFNFLYPYRNIADFALNPTEKMSIAKQIIELKKKYNILNSTAYLRAVGAHWTCYPWMLVSATADGKFSKGCMVEHIEPCKCEMCDMSCYSELAQAMKLKLKGWKSFCFAAGAGPSFLL